MFKFGSQALGLGNREQIGFSQAQQHAFVGPIGRLGSDGMTRARGTNRRTPGAATPQCAGE